MNTISKLEKNNLKSFLRDVLNRNELLLSAIKPDSIIKTRSFVNDVDSAIDWVYSFNEKGYNIYFSVNPTKNGVKKKASKKDILKSDYYHLDVDPSDVLSIDKHDLEWYTKARKKVLEVADSLKDKADFIIDSGNGIGVYFRNDRELNLEDTEKVNKYLVENIGGDKSATDVSRIMRLPFTFNYPNQKKLEKKLIDTTVSIVNKVGVDINSASYKLLSYVSGISEKIAKNIVELKNELGSFHSKEQIKKVKGLGAKGYEQSVGFFRIKDGKSFVDNSGIQTENYKVAL